MKRIISVLVENHFGVLARISGLFSGRGFNIESLAVGETNDPTISRMTIVVSGDDKVLDQVNKQLDKLIDVIKVDDLTNTNFIARDLALIKVNSTKKTRSEIIEIFSIFKAKIIDVTPDTITGELVGDEDKIEAFINMVKPYEIKELVRTGRIAIARG